MLLWLVPGALIACEAPPQETTVPTPSAGPGAPTEAPTASASAVVPAKTCATACLSIEKCEGGACVPNCPAGEVYIPATGDGGFTMGANLREGVDTPHKVVLTQPFCMDATEVTVKAYKECVDEEACEPPRLWGMWINYPKLSDHPVNKVHWNHAKTYCEWRKKALPTEAQWEWAATGGDGRKWAWGNDPATCEHADYAPGQLRTPSSDDGCNGGGTSPVGSLPKGDKVWPAGKLSDMSGNVWEWVLDNYQPWRHAKDEVDPLYMVAENSTHVVRGGGWNRSDVGIRTHYRGAAVADYQVPGLGFRCARNPGSSNP
jgi:formylglycine-generating enzyme required for sulfatase activity